MANATKLPILSYITFVQLSRPDAPNPRLSSAISAVATTLRFATPLLGGDGDVITEAMLLGCRNSASYTETILVPSGSLEYDAQTANFTVGSVLTGGTSGAKAIIVRDSDSGATGALTLIVYSGTFQNNETITDEAGGSATANGTLTAAISANGLTATGCVRGINLDGLDWITGDADLAVTHKAGDAVFCNISGVIGAMLTATLSGTLATGGAGFVIGTEPGASGETTTIYRTTTPGVRKGFFRWNASFAQFSNDGTTWVNCSDVSASDLAKVSANDTTAGYLNGKLIEGDGIDFTENNDGGNETLTIAVDVTEIISGDFGLEANSNDLRVKLATDPGLEFSTGVRVKVKASGGITRDSNGLSLTNPPNDTFTGTAGEAIDGSTTPQALAIGGTTFKKSARTETAANAMVFWDGGGGLPETTNFGNVDANSKVAQSFSFTDADAESITIEKISVMLGKVAAPTDDVTISVMSNSGSLPDNVVIANGTSAIVAGSGVSAASEYGFNTFTFATPPTITSGSTYWFVMNRSTGLDATNYYRVGRHGSSLVTGDYATYRASLSTWSAGSNRDMYYDIRFNVNYNGQVFKADSDNFGKCKYIGFTSSNVADAGAPTIQPRGIVTMAGLTPGATYFASSTPGGVTAAPSGSNCLVPVGTAVSTTQLLIERGVREYKKTFSSLRFASSANTTTVTADVLVETGFKPHFISISARYPGDANQNGAGMYNFVYGEESPALSIDSMGNTIVTAQTTATPASLAGTTGMGFDTSTYLAVSDIYENGFNLRYVSNDPDHYFADIYITARGY